MKVSVWVGLCLLFPASVWALPHSGTNIVTKTASVVNTSGTVVFWTPTKGSYIALMGCTISGNLIENVTIQSAGVNVLPAIYLTTGASVATINGGAVPLWVGGTNATLSYTVSATPNEQPITANNLTSVLCNGYEVP